MSCHDQEIEAHRRQQSEAYHRPHLNTVPRSCQVPSQLMDPFRRPCELSGQVRSAGFHRPTSSGCIYRDGETCATVGHLGPGCLRKNLRP